MAARGRVELGRHLAGRWYVEDTRDGRLREIEGVTHRARVLDSYADDESDDD